MSLHITPCKLCQKPIELEIGDDLPADWRQVFINWLNYVVCNHCGDLKQRRHRCIEYLIRKCLILARYKNTPDDETAIRNGMNIVLRKFAQVIAEYYKRPNTVPASVIENHLAMLMREPTKVMEINRLFWKACRACV